MSEATTAAVEPAAISETRRPLSEPARVAIILGIVLAAGSLAQAILPEGKAIFVATTGIAAAGLVAIGLALRRRLGNMMGGFRFATTVLFALAGASAVGTLILQGRAPGEYVGKYGELGAALVALRFDDIFHSLWFGGLVASLIAGLVISMVLRWPISTRNAGFFSCHIGLLLVMLGATLSALFAVKARVDLHAGSEATQAMVEKGGVPTGQIIPLGFTLKLDRFDVERYGTEHRLALYRPNGKGGYELKATFDSDVGVRHRLPHGAAVTIDKYYSDVGAPGFAAPAKGGFDDPAVVATVERDGAKNQVMFVERQRTAVDLGEGDVLTFERSDDEVKSYRSAVTAERGGDKETQVIAVNDPLRFAGWSVYQVNFDPKDPTYSGFEVVKDPGVLWVFLGFGFTALGVAYAFTIEPRRKKSRAKAAAAV